MVLYFYQWKNEYLQCMESIKEIAVPYIQILQSPEVFREIKHGGIFVYGVLPAVSAGFHDLLLRELALKGGRFDGISLLKHTEKQRDPGIRHLSEMVDGIYIGNQGQWENAKMFRLPLFGDQGLNVFNSKTAEFWIKKGLERVTLSYELETEQIREMWYEGEREILLYGRVPVMVSEYCPVAGEKGISKKNCGICRDGGTWHLQSKKGDRYPVLLDRDVCRSTILSAFPLDRRKEMAGTGKDGREDSSTITGRICIYDETPAQVEKILKSV